MATEANALVMTRRVNFAIVDEVDSVVGGLMWVFSQDILQT